MLISGLLEIWNIQLNRCSSDSPRGSCLPRCRGHAVPCVLVSLCFDVCLSGCKPWGGRATRHLSSLEFTVIDIIPKCLLHTHWRLRRCVTPESRSPVPSPESTSIQTPTQAATVLSRAPHQPDFLTHKKHGILLSPLSSEPPCLDAPPLTLCPLSAHCSLFLEALCHLVSWPSALFLCSH